MYKVNDVVYLRAPNKTEPMIARSVVTQVWTDGDEVCYSLRGIPFRVYCDDDLASNIHELFGKNRFVSATLLKEL